MPRALAPHGTLAAHRRHQRAGEVPCGPCTEAIRVYHVELRARHGARTRGPLQPCGTPGAYQRHIKRGEVPCGPCTAAVRKYVRKRIRARALRRRDPARYAALLERAARRAEAAALATHGPAIADALARLQADADGGLVVLPQPTLAAALARLAATT